MTAKRKYGTTFSIDLSIREMSLGEGRLFVSTMWDIKKRKKAEDDAAEKSALLTTTLDAMAQGYAIFDADMRLVAFNKQYEVMFKFAEGFLRPGRSMEEIIRYRMEHQLYWENTPIVDDTVEHRLKQFQISSDSSGERTMNTGTTFVYTRKPMPGGGFVTRYTDITKLKEAETALRKTETQLSVLADTTPVLISYIDRDRIIRFSNKAYAARHGLTPDQICGTQLEQYWDVDRHESVREMIEQILAGKVTNNEGYREHADGTVRYHVVSRTPHFDDDGNVLGCFNVILDTTELKLA
ncbi:MAG: PAS domain S-box-containing protein [Alphaproteobacteria bacterium]|jgi:PAS domain S-box-containing protein